MKKFSLKAIALLVAMSASSAFAAGGADFDPTANFGDITAITSDSVATEISGALADTFDVATGVFAQNVALIAQIGDGNFALIDQQGGTANFAGVIQDASANGANVAVIQQTGNFNRAFKLDPSAFKAWMRVLLTAHTLKPQTPNIHSTNP